MRVTLAGSNISGSISSGLPGILNPTEPKEAATAVGGSLGGGICSLGGRIRSYILGALNCSRDIT